MFAFAGVPVGIAPRPVAVVEGSTAPLSFFSRVHTRLPPPRCRLVSSSSSSSSSSTPRRVVRLCAEPSTAAPSPTGRVPRLLITGAPASGKGTQCAMIVDSFSPVHISTGDLLRAATADPESELGRQAAGFMSTGKLVPDELVIELLLARLAKDDVAKRGWLLDGFPRTAAQADFLDGKGIVPDLVIALNVADKTVVTRIAGRRTDPVTGTIYHVDLDPATDEDVIARLVQRADDTEEKVTVRLGLYHEYAEAILAKYKDKVVRVDGERSKEDVFLDVKAAIAVSIGDDKAEKKRPLSVVEFVEKAEEAFENGGGLGIQDTNWSGQAGISGPWDDGESNYSDLGRRPGLVVCDVVALVAFGVIGRLSHDLPVFDLALVKTVGPFILGWLAVAPMLGGYTSKATESWSQMVRTTLACWAVGIPLGLTLRGFEMSHVPSSTFAAVSLATTLTLLLASRSAYVGVNGVSSPEGKRGGFLDGFRMVTTLLKRW